MEDINRLLGLAVVLLVSIGAIWLLMRHSSAPVTRQGSAQGYPPDLFPDTQLTRSGALALLAATQARLILIERQVPEQSELAIWLQAFLRELREIMDVAYRAAAVAQIYGDTSALDMLTTEVQTIETQIAAHVARRLLDRDGDTQRELLDGRLATLRLCVRQLSLDGSMIRA